MTTKIDMTRNERTTANPMILPWVDVDEEDESSVISECVVCDNAHSECLTLD